MKALAIGGGRHFLPIEEARFWPHNRIVWAGPRETPVWLQQIVNSLNSDLKANEIRTEARAFAAHITLIRNAHAPDALPPLPRLRWPVEEVVLVESRRADAGRRYEVLRRYALA